MRKREIKGWMIGGIIGAFIGILLILMLLIITMDKPDVGFASFIIITLGVFFLFLSTTLGIIIGMKKWKLFLIIIGCFFIPPIISRMFFGKDVTASVFISIGLIILIIITNVISHITKNEK